MFRYSCRLPVPIRKSLNLDPSPTGKAAVLYALKYGHVKVLKHLTSSVPDLTLSCVFWDVTVDPQSLYRAGYLSRSMLLDAYCIYGYAPNSDQVKYISGHHIARCIRYNHVDTIVAILEHYVDTSGLLTKLINDKNEDLIMAIPSRFYCYWHWIQTITLRLKRAEVWMVREGINHKR
jgi:hypothetical protein